MHLLGAMLDPTKGKSGAKDHALSGKGKSSTTKSKAIAAGGTNRVDGGGLRDLCVLALTNAYLSRHTVQTLKVVS